MKRKNPR